MAALTSWQRVRGLRPLTADMGSLQGSRRDRATVLAHAISAVLSPPLLGAAMLALGAAVQPFVLGRQAMPVFLAVPLVAWARVRL